MRDEFVHHCIENLLGDLSTLLDVMLTITKDFRLNDWHKTIVLANLTISGKRMSSLSDGNFRRAIITNFDDGSPLGESGTHLIVGSSSLGKAIETLSLGFIISSFDENHTSIDLDSSEDSLFGKVLGEVYSIRVKLTNGLIVHDGTTDVFFKVLS